mmetsp:Transcript_4996/g.9659  ORF Transcript_4996/g.9659 Transcript_4996/m.9659 type:complete len:129 (+) Transcript_4996:222-608(+)
MPVVSHYKISLSDFPGTAATVVSRDEVARQGRPDIYELFSLFSESLPVVVPGNHSPNEALSFQPFQVSSTSPSATRGQDKLKVATALPVRTARQAAVDLYGSGPRAELCAAKSVVGEFYFKPEDAEYI